MSKVLATLVIAIVEQLFDLLSDKRKNCSKMKLNVDPSPYGFDTNYVILTIDGLYMGLQSISK